MVILVHTHTHTHHTTQHLHTHLSTHAHQQRDKEKGGEDEQREDCVYLLLCYIDDPRLRRHVHVLAGILHRNT